MSSASRPFSVEPAPTPFTTADHKAPDVTLPLLRLSWTRERQRQRDRDRQRETEIETERQRQTETDRQRQRYTETEIETERQRQTQTDRDRDTQRQRETDSLSLSQYCVHSPVTNSCLQINVSALLDVGWLVECCFTSTETIGLLGTGLLDFVLIAFI